MSVLGLKSETSKVFFSLFGKKNLSLPMTFLTCQIELPWSNQHPEDHKDSGQVREKVRERFKAGLGTVWYL